MAKRQSSYTTKPVPAQVNIITTYVCDICFEDIGQRISKRRCFCVMCDRTMHDNGKCGDEHPEHSGYDYPDHLCRICLDLYNEKFIPLQKSHDDIQEAMLEKIKKESLAWQPNQKQ